MLSPRADNAAAWLLSICVNARENACLSFDWAVNPRSDGRILIAIQNIESHEQKEPFPTQVDSETSNRFRINH